MSVFTFKCFPPICLLGVENRSKHNALPLGFWGENFMSQYLGIIRTSREFLDKMLD
jgi:hypothetical protein